MNAYKFEESSAGSDIRILVEEFYRRLLADDRVKTLFDGADLEYILDMQTDFLRDAAGESVNYEGPDIKEAHEDVSLELRDLNRALEIFDELLDDANLESDDKERLIGAISNETENIM